MIFTLLYIIYHTLHSLFNNLRFFLRDFIKAFDVTFFVVGF